MFFNSQIISDGKINDFGSFWLLDENSNSYFGGNKFRKLKGILDQSVELTGIISMGSPFSSHLLACAYFARILSVPFVGIVLSDDEIIPDRFPNLKMSQNIGAKFVNVDIDGAYQKIEIIKEKYSDYFWIPGGAHTLEAANAYKDYFDKLFDNSMIPEHISNIVLPLGTGTTAYGIWKSVRENRPHIVVHGVSVAREYKRIQAALIEMEGLVHYPGFVVDDRFAGTYGKTTDELDKMRWDFFIQTGILVDPVYNSKAVNYMLNESISNTLFVNTGGLLNNML